MTIAKNTTLTNELVRIVQQVDQEAYARGRKDLLQALVNYAKETTPNDTEPLEAPHVIARPLVCDDRMDLNTERYGQRIGIDYIAGSDREGYETSIYIPDAPSNNPLDVPYIRFLGEQGVPVDDFIMVYHQITALLRSSEVLAARKRFASQKAHKEARNN